MVRARDIVTALGVFLFTGFQLAFAQEAFKPLPFDKMQFMGKLYDVARSNGIRASLGPNAGCELSDLDGRRLYFCTYPFAGTRVRLWTKENDAYGPLVMISLHARGTASPDRVLLDVSLIVSTIDPSLTEAEVRNIAEQLVSVGRQLSGKTTVTGKAGSFSATLSSDGLVVVTATARS